MENVWKYWYNWERFYSQLDQEIKLVLLKKLKNSETKEAENAKKIMLIIKYHPK